MQEFFYFILPPIPNLGWGGKCSNMFVIRDGNESSIEAAKLVPGDLIRVKGGENIPADIRVVECHEMKVNNASLTGESDCSNMYPPTGPPAGGYMLEPITCTPYTP